jgi:hypothetical protein
MLRRRLLLAIATPHNQQVSQGRELLYSSNHAHRALWLTMRRYTIKIKAKVKSGLNCNQQLALLR